MSLSRLIDKDFLGIEPIEHQLQAEIDANINIEKKLKYITRNGNVVDLTFSANLNADEINELDVVIIPNHIPDNSKNRINSLSIKIGFKPVGFESYTLISTFKYQGSNLVGLIDYIDIISHINSSSGTYDIKVVNINTMDSICEKIGLSNNSPSTQNLGIISNIPEEPEILQVYIRRVGGLEGDLIHVNEIIVYHGN